MKDVTKSFGANHVLKKMTLDIHEGESLVIIGGSGIGKSVTIKCIQGILTPETGSIKVDGEEITIMGATDLARVNKKMGMLFQGAALFDSLTVWENVAFGLIEGKGMTPTEAKTHCLGKFKTSWLACICWKFISV